MRLEQFLLSILLFSVLVVAGVLVIADINNSYSDVNISTENFNMSVYNISGDIYSTTQGMKGHTLGGDVDEDSTENSMFKGAYSAIRLISNSFSWVGNIINSVSKEIPGLKIFIQFALAAVSILIIFGLIYLVFRYKG